MNEPFRLTAKFKSIHDSNNQTYTTSSLIVISHPHSPHIQWRRRYGEIIQQLNHFDNHPLYQCSYLDADCYIEALTKSSEFPSNTAKTSYLSFGPIQRENCFDSIEEDWEWVIEIPVGNSKIYQCLLTLAGNQIILCQRNYLGKGQSSFQIQFQQILLSYLEDHNKSSRLLVFPAVLLRTVCLKLFSEIISKQNYKQNNYPLKIRVINATSPNNKTFEEQNFAENYLLYRINRLKHQKDRRESKISNYGTKKTPNSHFLQLEDSFRGDKKQQKESTRTNQVTQIQQKMPENNNNLQSNEQPEQQLNYFEEFEQLIYEEQKDKQKSENQALALNESFEELEKKGNSQKQIQRLKQIRKKKMQRCCTNVEKLKVRLLDLKIEKQQLIKVNKKLRSDIEKMNHHDSFSGEKEKLEKTKNQLFVLKNQYNQLLEKGGKMNVTKSQKDLHQPHLRIA